jgi:hypothetical protein
LKESLIRLNPAIKLNPERCEEPKLRVLGHMVNEQRIFMDPAKVKASWAFQHEDGRKAFIWCYKESWPRNCTSWSTDGSKELLKELFGDESVK